MTVRTWENLLYLWVAQAEMSLPGRVRSARDTLFRRKLTQNNRPTWIDPSATLPLGVGCSIVDKFSHRRHRSKTESKEANSALSLAADRFLRQTAVAENSRRSTHSRCEFSVCFLQLGFSNTVRLDRADDFWTVDVVICHLKYWVIQCIFGNNTATAARVFPDLTTEVRPAHLESHGILQVSRFQTWARSWTRERLSWGRWCITSSWRDVSFQFQIRSHCYRCHRAHTLWRHNSLFEICTVIQNSLLLGQIQNDFIGLSR